MPADQRRTASSLEMNFPYRHEKLSYSTPDGSMIVYAATVGEFRLAQPFIKRIQQEWPDRLLVLIAGQEKYLDLLQRSCPRAVVGLPPSPRLARELFRLTRPKLVVISHGPCLFGYFPITLSQTLAAVSQDFNVPFIVVDASVHRLSLSSRLEPFEFNVFSDIWRDAVDHWYPPNESLHAQLLKLDVPTDRVTMLGDIKFDTTQTQTLSVPLAELEPLLDFYREGGGPTIVAGSVNAIDEQAPVIRAWQAVAERHPGAKLIIAPRHVDRPQAMGPLFDFLRSEGLSYARRSEGIESALQADILVVDVFGELPFYYGIGQIAYLGRNHGVLEPMKFGVPTVVAPRQDWDGDYVTYPLYLFMVEAGGLIEVDDKENLGDLFVKIIENHSFKSKIVNRAREICERERGVSDRILAHLTSNILPAYETNTAEK